MLDSLLKHVSKEASGSGKGKWESVREVIVVLGDRRGPTEDRRVSLLRAESASPTPIQAPPVLVRSLAKLLTQGDLECWVMGGGGWSLGVPGPGVFREPVIREGGGTQWRAQRGGSQCPAGVQWVWKRVPGDPRPRDELNSDSIHPAVTEALRAPGKISGCSGTRNLHDNLSDLRAQVAANQKGIQLVGELIGQYGLDVVQAYMGHIQVGLGAGG